MNTAMHRFIASRTLAWTLSLAFVTLACGGNTSSNSGNGSPGGGDGGAHGNGSDASTGGAPSPGLLGVWKGFVQGYSFDDGMNSFTLTLEAVEPSVVGHIQFGEKALLPPPTDPNIAYPLGLSWSNSETYSTVVSGFVYALSPEVFDGQRLQFQVFVDELWTSWCALQTPIYDEGFGKYSCAHHWGMTAGGSTGCTQTDPSTGQILEIDCGKLILCDIGSVCSCDAQSCTSSRFHGGPTFDLNLIPPKGEGVVGGLDWSVHNVYLQKQ